MSAQYIAQHKDEWANFKEFVWDAMPFPCKITYKSLTGMRTISQNALVHMWFGQMAKEFSLKGFPLTEKDAKRLMKHEFLGYEDVKIGSTVIEAQLRHTSDLDTGEMSDFMDKVDHWNVDKGVYLIKPVDSEYMKLKEAQVN